MKRQNDKYNQVWKMKTIYDKLNGSYGHDSPNEHLAVDIKYCAIHFQTLYVKET